MKSKGIVAAGDYHTAKAAAKVLEIGGNAFDASVAAFFTSCLTEIPLTSPAGGGYLTYFNSTTKEVKYYDFFVNYPLSMKNEKDFYPITVDFGAAKQIFHIGYASTAAPGSLAGILNLHKEFGSLNLKDILDYPLNLAKNGFHISKFISYVINDLLAPIFLSTKNSRKVFAPFDKLINHKTFFKNYEFVQFLERVISENEHFFYSGDLAKKISDQYQENNGLLTYEDLSNYSVKKSETLCIKYKEYEIHLPFASSIGGMLLYFSIQNLLEKNFFNNQVELFVEIMQQTTSFRNTFFNEENIENFLTISKNKYTKIIKSKMNILGNTTHFSIVDKFQNAVSCTTSNGEGSGVVIENTGFMMNNMLGEEDLNPFGFFNWKQGYRLFSMMSPMIILKNNDFYLALGSSGSNRIRSAILNTIFNYFFKKYPLDKAINSPRIHFENNTIFFEKGLENLISKNLQSQYKIIEFDKPNMFFGGVHAVSAEKGAADKRRNGHVIIVN